MDDLTRARVLDVDEETGPPVRELGLLRLEPRPGFVERIRRSIQRRLLLADALELGWGGLIEVLVQSVRRPDPVDARPPRVAGRRGRTNGRNRPVDE